MLRRTDWSMGAAAGLGLLSCAALVLTAGRSARVPGAAPSSSWLGLLGPMRSPMPSATLAGIEIGAVLLLVLAWWWLLRGARRWPVRRLELVGLLWAAPLAMGPPLLSLDAYSYLAQGRLAALGIDPYQHAPSTLGPGVWLRGVDPFWRDALSPYGPLAVLLERASTLPGSPVAALVLLHLLALGALVVLALVVRRLAPSAQRGTVLLLVVVNPLVLLQLLGAAHWEALLVALLALALLAWQRDHPAAALALASTAAAVKLPAAFAVGVFLVLQVLAAGRTRRLQTAATGVAAATAPWLLLSLLVPNALGYAADRPDAVRTDDAPGRGHGQGRCPHGRGGALRLDLEPVPGRRPPAGARGVLRPACDRWPATSRYDDRDRAAGRRTTRAGALPLVLHVGSGAPGSVQPAPPTAHRAAAQRGHVHRLARVRPAGTRVAGLRTGTGGLRCRPAGCRHVGAAPPLCRPSPTQRPRTRCPAGCAYLPGVGRSERGPGAGARAAAGSRKQKGRQLHRE